MTHALATTTDGPAAAVDPRLPAPINKRALAGYLTLIEDPDTLRLQNRLAGAYDAACTALLGPNDIQVESGRSFKKKSAWRKLARYFGISTTVIEHSERYLVDETTGESVFLATCTVRGTAPWGQSSDAAGACATDEESGRRKISIADAIATAETRAANRATSNLVAMGEVSAEEMTRDERTRATAEADVADMTLDQAKAVPYPWRTPPKYKDGPMGALSSKMLDAVLKQMTKELTEQGTTPQRLALQRAAQLLRPVAVERERMEREAKGAPAAATETATETEPAKEPTLDELNAAVTKLIEHKALPAAARGSYRAWHKQATTPALLRELIASLEESIEDGIESNKLRTAAEAEVEEAKLRQRDDGELEERERYPFAGDVDD